MSLLEGNRSYTGLISIDLLDSLATTSFNDPIVRIVDALKGNDAKERLNAAFAIKRFVYAKSSFVTLILQDKWYTLPTLVRRQLKNIVSEKNYGV